MIEMNSLLQQQATQRPSAAGCTDERVLRQAARDLFGRLQAQTWRSRLLAVLSSRRQPLLDLASCLVGATLSSQRFTGRQVVPSAAIRGSEGRCLDFDADFRPLNDHSRERWVSIAVAWQLGQPLPPVELIRIGDCYFVRDGHHRVSVARAMGQREIEARVTVWQLTDRHAA